MTPSFTFAHPAELKARWVRQSQAEGKKLSDWIVWRVDGKQSTPTPKEPKQ